MKRGVVLIFVFIFCMSFIVAEEINFKQVECQSILQYKDQIIGQEIPSQVPFKNEIFNIYIAGESYGFMELNESRVVGFDCLENEDATYDLLIESEGALFEIYGSEDLMDTVLDKMNSKEINIKGKTLVKKPDKKLKPKIWKKGV